MTVDSAAERKFVRRSVAMQLGTAHKGFAQSEKAMLRALQGSSGIAVAYMPGERKLYALDGASTLKRVSRNSIQNNLKTSGALESILACDPQFGFVVDMQDRRLRNVAEQGEEAFPVFCFNRQMGDEDRILWPLPIYHDLDGDQFLTDIQWDRIDWADKKSHMIWRGAVQGRAEGTGAGRGEGMRIKSALRKYARGELSEDKLQTIVSSAPRYKVVSKVAGDERFDFGFVDGAGFVISEVPFHAELARPRVSPVDMQTSKYIAVLRGVDVGSSFYWVMNSGSLGFVQRTPFETFASAHFKRWQHFIPFREDASNLVKAFEWAEKHPERCQEMVQKAKGVCELLARPDLRQKILNTVIQHLNDTLNR